MQPLAAALQDFDWKQEDSPYYFAIGGAIIAVIAIILYFIPASRLKIPGIVAGILGGLVVGVGAGMAAMAFLGYHWDKPRPSNENPPEGGAGQMRGMMGGGPPGGGMGGGPPGGGMMGGMGGGRGGGGRGGRGTPPNYKAQLASLVIKLDQLTGNDLKLDLTDEQKTKVREQLKGLADTDKLSNEEAQKKVDALLVILKEDDKKKLDAAGFRQGGGGGGGRGGGRGGEPAADAPDNPFKEGDNSKHLKSLQGRLGKESKV